MIIPMIGRYRGAMVGVLCGDALGAPYEWKKASEVEADVEVRGGLIPHEYEPFDYVEPWKGKRHMERGQPTDDSELAAALAQSFVHTGQFDANDIYMRLRGFIIGRNSILAERAYGSGSTLRAALSPETYEESLRKFAADEIPIVPSNGSLMRCIAVPLRFPDFFRGIKAADRQSEITHRHPVSRAACIAYTIFVTMLLDHRHPPATAWNRTALILRKIAWNPQVMWQVGNIPIRAPTEEEVWPAQPRGPGDALLSLQVAVWATMSAESFADGILKAISVGGDTDTYAAIAGGALGVRFGIQGIPERWASVLKGKDVMLSLADGLHELAYPEEALRA